MAKYLIIVMILCWLLFDLYNLYTVATYSKTKLMSGTVREIIKYTGYNNASLKLQVEIIGNKAPIWVIGKFRPNLRWWLQSVPKINQQVYFYIKPEAVPIPYEPQSAYAISPNKKPSRAKLIYDLFYDFNVNRSIIIGFLFIIVVFLLDRVIGVTGPILMYGYVYWLVHLFLEGVVI
jgi:hypothetical protein